MLIQSRYEKTVPITLLSDAWLVLSLPLMFINVVSFTLRRTLLATVFAIVRLPANLVLRVLSRFSFINTPVIIGVYALMMLLSLWRSPNASAIEASLCASLLLVLTMMVVILTKRMVDFRDGNRSDLALNFTKLNANSITETNPSFPTNLLIPELSQSTFLGSSMVTLFALVNLGILAIAPSSTLPFWIALVSLAALFLVDFEMIEHLASHSPKGQLLKIADKEGLNKTHKSDHAIGFLLYALEQIRIYVIWPLFFWPPNRYVLTHTYHHHIENNGPTDWQSTLRFNLSSLFDFSQSLLWLQISVLFPIDTLNYFRATGKSKQTKQLIASTIYHWALVLVAAWWNPWLVLTLFCAFFSMAWVFHAFIFAWHGFHDADKPFDVVASNNSGRHYAHHKIPSEHLFSPTVKQTYESEWKHDTDTHFPVHTSNDSMTLLTRHWLLVQCILWQKKFTVIRQLINASTYDNTELKRLIQGANLKKRHPTLDKLDQRLSKSFGRSLELCLNIITPAELSSQLHANQSH